MRNATERAVATKEGRQAKPQSSTISSRLRNVNRAFLWLFIRTPALFRQGVWRFPVSQNHSG